MQWRHRRLLRQLPFAHTQHRIHLAAADNHGEHARVLIVYRELMVMMMMWMMMMMMMMMRNDDDEE